MVADGEEAELVLYQIAAVHPKSSVLVSRQRGEGAGDVLQSVFASFYAGLRLRIAVQPPYDHLRICFGICKLGLRLLVVNGGCEQEAIDPCYLC